MKSIILTYPSFQTLPKAIKQMLVASESDFFSDAKPARTAGGPGKLGHRQLFPALARIHERHRAKMFIKRLKTIGVSGISLHSYRYAWAERAMEAGYPERFAMQALGHTSKAVHRALREEDPGNIAAIGGLRKTPDQTGGSRPRNDYRSLSKLNHCRLT